MIFAMPTIDGKLAAHFGHARDFEFIKVEDGKITSKEIAIPPGYEPGVLPTWLNSKKVDKVIVGGMGTRAVGYFNKFGIDIIYGKSSETPEKVVNDYLKGDLEARENFCDH
ncbi:MAG: ATPase [Candidatus Eremiobacteraeota bacterium]|nr:ATPase [Candidatus Eremiobacteraeota bacterium]